MKKLNACKICRARARKKIELDLINGVPYKELTEKYNVSYPTLKKHKEEHIPVEVAKAMRANMLEFTSPPKLYDNNNIPQLDNLFECVNYLHNEMLAIHIGARKTGNDNLSLKAMRNDLECLQLALKGKELMMSYSAQSDWDALLSKILLAVDSNIEAKMAIAEVLYSGDYYTKENKDE